MTMRGCGALGVGVQSCCSIKNIMRGRDRMSWTFGRGMREFKHGLRTYSLK